MLFHWLALCPRVSLQSSLFTYCLSSSTTAMYLAQWTVIYQISHRLVYSVYDVVFFFTCQCMPIDPCWCSCNMRPTSGNVPTTRIAPSLVLTVYCRSSLAIRCQHLFQRSNPWHGFATLRPSNRRTNKTFAHIRFSLIYTRLCLSTTSQMHPCISS